MRSTSLSLALAAFCLSTVVTSSHGQLSKPAGVTWYKLYGGSEAELGKAIFRTSDGGYFVGADTSTSTVNWDYWLFKLDSAHTIQWSRHFGGSGEDHVAGVVQLPNGVYVAAGFETSGDGDVIGHHGQVFQSTTTEDGWILGLDDTGKLLWQKTMGGDGDDFFTSIAVTHDGGFIVTGMRDSTDSVHTMSNTLQGIWVIKFTAGGMEQWERFIRGTRRDIAYSVVAATDGGYLLGGASRSSTGIGSGHNGDSLIDDCLLVKLDSAGNVMWSKTFGTPDHDGILSVIVTSSGDYAFTGYESFANRGSDVLVGTMAANGELGYTNTYGGSSLDMGRTLIETADHGFLIGGNTLSTDGDLANANPHGGGYDDGWLLKVDPTIRLQWSQCYGGSRYDYISNLLLMPDSSYMFVGYTDSYDGNISQYAGHGSTDVWIAQLKSPTPKPKQWVTANSEATGHIVWNGRELGYSVENYAEIEIRLFDLLGREVGTLYRGVQDRGQYELDIPRGLTNATYFCKFVTNSQTAIIPIALGR